MKYVTVKLTEDQINHLIQSMDYAWVASEDEEANKRVIAYQKRLKTKLVKAKS